MIITILPSDDAAGVFGFDPSSLARVVEEQPGGTPIALTIVRMAGTFGDVRIHWEVEGSSGDIIPANGYVDFAVEQTEGVLQLTVTDDAVSEVLFVSHVYFTLGDYPVSP